MVENNQLVQKFTVMVTVLQVGPGSCIIPYDIMNVNEKMAN